MGKNYKQKKYFCLSVLLALIIFIFAGCDWNSLFNFNNGDVTWPTSADSRYSSAVVIDTNATASQIAETLVESCVTVMTISKITNEEIAFGSGVCIYAGGYIVTNHHVISTYLSDKTKYKVVTYLNASIEELETQVLWYDQKLDIAVIQCEEANIPFVNIKDRVIYPETNDKIRLLEQVIAIGTPVDFSFQNWCTIGEVAKLNAYTTSEGNLYECLIGHTAAINHGNSGGGLFDMRGNLIGLNTLGDDSANSLFFAIPVYPLTLVLNRIVVLNEKETPEKLVTPSLGIQGFDGIYGELSNKAFKLGCEGLYVDVVNEGSCKDVLLSGDVILSISVKGKVFNIENRYYVLYALLSSDINDSATLSVKRGNETLSKDIILKKGD